MNRSVAFFAVTLILGLFSPVFLLASPLENLRIDVTVPEHCRTTAMEDFDQDSVHIFTVGPTGARERGFDYEFPLLRQHATILYKTLNADEGKRPEWEARIRRHPGLWEDYQVLCQHHIERDFHFQNEGEILELLSIVRMQRRLDEQNSGLFVSGSVEYHGHAQRSTLGELDMIVADRLNCEIIGYGEVKLGLGSIGKARRQVRRFFDFMYSNGLSPRWLDPDLGWFNDFQFQN